MTALRTALLAISLLVASRSSAEAPPGPGSTPASTAAVPTTPTPPVTSGEAASVAPEPFASRVGLGVGIGAGGTPAALYVPFDFGRLRIEPEVAYARVGTDEANVATTLLGLGLFGLVPIAPTIRSDVGVRVLYARDQVTETLFIPLRAKVSSSSEAILVAAVLGGEWLPAPYFSLGVEGRLAYAAAAGNRVSALDVSAQAILRVFLSTSRQPTVYGATRARQANTAMKVTGRVKLELPAGKANPDPPVGPALGQYGVDVPGFCKQFNAATQAQAQEGAIIPVVVTVYEDRSFTFELKTPRARPAPLTKCQRNSDCEAPDFCFDGRCRH